LMKPPEASCSLDDHLCSLLTLSRPSWARRGSAATTKGYSCSAWPH